MAKASNRKLKVFQAQFGFYDVVVAAPSQAAALRAWGVHQNLFAEGMARVIDDPEAVDAALAHPGALLKRAVGSADPFALDPVNLPAVPSAARKAQHQPKRGSRASPPPEPPPADRGDLDSAERALRELEEAWKQREAEFRRRREELDAAEAAEAEAYKAKKKAGLATVSIARRAYRDAGGRD